MLNRAPIFISGLRRSGTDLLADIISSHPDVCSLSGETYEVFYGDQGTGPGEAILRRALYLPLQALSEGKLMYPPHLDDRRPLSRLAMRYMDLLFYIDKLTSHKCTCKYDGVPYTWAEKRAIRFLSKSVNGTILMDENFAAAYPDATFIGIIRDGLAVCEGHKRRGTKPEKFARTYDRICRKMLEHSRTIPNYHLVRYEDMVTDPIGFMRRVFPLAGLDPDATPKVFLRARRVMQSDGKMGYTFGSGVSAEINSFPVAEMPRIILSNANENQRRRLSAEDRASFNGIAGDVMKELGYEL